MMTKHTLLSVLGAALLASAALTASGATRPTSAQTSSSSSSSTAKKKRHTTSSKSKRKSRAKAQMTPTPDRIKEIQTALQKDGSYEGEPTGKWDAATEEAMKKYQDKNGFPVTGKIDAVSLNKLGLGADTAGKGAPAPSPTSAPTATSNAAAVPTAPAPTADPTSPTTK